jgi:GT2 family glycosyltransferase
MKSVFQSTKHFQDSGYPFISGTDLEFDFSYQQWVQQFGNLSDHDDVLIAEHIQQIELQPINVVWLVTSQMDRFDFSLLIGSLKNQILAQWRLHIVVPPDFASRMRRMVMDATSQDARISLASDDWVIKNIEAERNLSPVLLIEGEGQLAPHALYLFALQVQAGKEFVYADEDTINILGRHSPLFKPSYSPELARQSNYFGSFGLVASRHPAAVQAVQGFVNQTADLADTFRALSFLKAPQVGHIPFVLLHAKRKRNYVPNKPLQAESIRTATATDLPSVTIIIPTKNHLDFLQPCLTSIFEKTTYPVNSYDIIVIDNGSTDEDVLSYMDDMVKAQKITLLKDASPFNFSRLNNKAVQICKGDILVFLNNDIVIDSPEWLSMLVEQAIKPDVGVVGGKLLYPDRTIQHAGLVLGLYGHPAVHIHTHWIEYADSYMGFNNAVREISTLTGACIALKKKVFLEAGCFDEKLAVTFNDIALCLAILLRGYRNIYIGNTLAIHYESKTRGYDDTDDKQHLHRQEAAYTRSLFHNLIKEDPFYNPNLSWLDLYGLAYPPRVQKPWLQFNAQQSACLNILFLTVTEPPEQKTLDMVIRQAQYFFNQGHKVYVNCDLPIDIADKFECIATLHNEVEATKFAVKNNIHCIIAHGVPFYASARWLGRAVVTVAIDYGDSSAGCFDTEQSRKNHMTERELSICAADLVCSFSESERVATHHHNKMVLFKNDGHLDQLHTQVLNLVRLRAT